MSSPRMRFAMLLACTFPLTVVPARATNWEEEFRKLPDPARIRETIRTLSAHAHHVGSPHDKANALWILDQFKQWGLDARIEEFEVLFPTPLERQVELVEPHTFVAVMKEPPVEGDPTSALQDEQLPTYNAYSCDGDVTAPLVYVNYGIPSDYEQLDRMGISVKGSIVIARYGGSWRGTKPKVAAEHGAVGCLIYSDPEGDGFYQGQTYPRGPWRPPDGVQRGSVMDMPVYPGDPLTPGVAATKNAHRLSRADASTLTRIPVLPLSYADARPLLEALGGQVAPEAWRGSLPFTYRVGPGPARVHMHVKSSWDIKPIYDVIATIEGSVYPDQWVIRGNHHDAWVFGAEDPLSGLAPLLEEARSFGRLLKEGWRPKRTIIYCAWDGEEEGLLGSTEWVEAHERELLDHAVIYINSDANGRGYLAAAGSQSLEHFLNDVARDVPDPETGLTVWERLDRRRIADARSPDDRTALRQRPDLKIGALGSGSDYTAFLCHVGVPSLNLGFGGEDGGGIYHSIYDSFTWYTHFSDTDFVYGRALAQLAGTAILRMADADLVPYRFGNFAEAVRSYSDDVQQLVKSTRESVVETNREIDEGVFRATADPHQPRVPPSREPVPPYLNFAPLQNALAALEAAAQSYDNAAVRLKDRGLAGAADAVLLRAERALLRPEGLPHRPWFRYQITAPGMYTGYGAKTLPAIREAIDEKDWKRAGDEIPDVAAAIQREAAVIDSAASILQAPAK